jgi:hypothetical protein
LLAEAVELVVEAAVKATAAVAEGQWFSAEMVATFAQGWTLGSPNGLTPPGVA